MKKVIKLIGTGIWMYWSLLSIREFRRDIWKYRNSGEIEKEKEAILKSTTRWGSRIVKKLDIQLHVEGLENIPKEGPVVFASNHQGYCDIPIFGAVIQSRQFGFIAKSSLKKLPLYGNWIKDVRSVFIERDDPRESLKAIERGIELLNQGFSLGVFPEGTRSHGPEMSHFKKGSLRVATKPGVPVIPVTINGTWKMFEEHGYPCTAKVDFIVHPAIETKDLSKSEASNLAEHVENIIRSKLEELNGKNGTNL